jgi:hypothetical protein
MKRGLNGIPCLGVGELEVEDLFGGNAVAGRGQGDAGGSQISQTGASGSEEAGQGACHSLVILFSLSLVMVSSFVRRGVVVEVAGRVGGAYRLQATLQTPAMDEDRAWSADRERRGRRCSGTAA